jgi:hypothetical protein
MDKQSQEQLDEFVQYVRKTEGFKTLPTLSKNDRLRFRQRIAEQGVEMTPGEMDDLCDLIIYLTNPEDY